MKDMLRLTIAALMISNGSKMWELQEPITVRLSGADDDLFEIWGLSVSPDPEKHLYIMDGAGEWTEITLEHRYASVIINAVHRRVFKDFKQLKSNAA